MSRRKIAAGNWKMNTNHQDGVALAQAINTSTIPTDVSVVLGVPFTHLHAVASAATQANITVAAQNMHQEDKGAYTGEISAAMLKGIGVNTVILGHSERRQYQKESNELLAHKLNKALEHDMEVIFCCGETLNIRQADKHVEFVSNQLRESCFHLQAEQWRRVVLAYEPIWAIGTGETASPAQAQEMHKAIRSLLAEQYGAELANSVSILYGGSVKPANAKEIFSQPDVDGGLVGGASLKSDDFGAIIDAFE